MVVLRDLRALRVSRRAGETEIITLHGIIPAAILTPRVGEERGPGRGGMIKVGVIYLKVMVDPKRPNVEMMLGAAFNVRIIQEEGKRWGGACMRFRNALGRSKCRRVAAQR